VEELQRGSMSLFSQQMASLVGPAYIAAFGTGIAYGFVHKPDARMARSWRLVINSYFNNVGRTATHFGNNTAAAVLLYVMTGKFTNFIFQEELDDFKIQNRYDTTIYGAMTGMIYKCTRGRRAMMLGSVLGALVGTSYGYLWRNNYLYKK